MTFGRLLLLVSMALFTACASLLHGPSETISVESEPPGADVSIVCSAQRVASGVTPTRLTIPRRGDGCEAVFTKEGFSTARVPLERGFSAPFWADVAMTCALGIVPGFFIGGRNDVAGAAAVVGTIGAASWFYDRRSGAMHDHSPAVIRQTLATCIRSAWTPAAAARSAAGRRRGTSRRLR